ncbi:uncharacterized protein ACA1_057560 [Acanthamoeba castellanii str. Neff]|uniref:Uncharacterized protein n=1 Tax=Acanthamoeba castellanii (strain ATCC 30010 / Neff) TaxID=1257118 RepID=L8GVV7_ACACF|nr:uncharacterized protein ACA1_057560 [Acanthamoeba castellanii str. Neff]ELR17120.1 hypothetical protein ACA1_057560 [Acanthamoeba castellanii str. Neff]
MLCNFGHLCKVLPFQFLSIISHCTTHSSGLKTLLHVNNNFLSCTLQQGYMMIQPPGQPSFQLPLALCVCADDPMLRFFLRLQQSSSIYCCVYCLWLHACMAIPSCGSYLDASNTAPMVISLHPYNMVFCMLHTLCHVGKLMANLIYNYIASQVNPTPLFTQIFALLGPTLGLEAAIMECITNLHHVFHMLYLFEPLTPEHANKWSWFKDHVDDIMAHFQRLVAQGWESNYMHKIQKHSITLLKHAIPALLDQLWTMSALPDILSEALK